MYPRIISESDNIIICSNNSKELFKLFFLIKINERINFIDLFAQVWLILTVMGVLGTPLASADPEPQPEPHPEPQPEPEPAPEPEPQQTLYSDEGTLVLGTYDNSSPYSYSQEPVPGASTYNSWNWLSSSSSASSRSASMGMVSPGYSGVLYSGNF